MTKNATALCAKRDACLTVDELTMLEPPASRATRRQALRKARHARYRARVRDGKLVALVELGREELDYLIAVHWLTEAEASAGDARVIGERIAAGIAASAKG
jgi:hypothetical protein